MGSESSESAGDNGQADPVNGYWYWDRSSGQTHPRVFVGSWWYSNLTMSCMFSVQSSRMKASSGTSIGNGSRLAELLFLGDEHPQLAAPTWRETHTFQGELIQRCIHPAVRLMWWACVAYRHNPLLLLHYPLHVRIWYISYLIFVEIHSCRLMDRWMNGWIDRP